MQVANVLSLHVLQTDETADMIDADAIATMKPSAVLINTACGSIGVSATEPLTAKIGAEFSGVPNLIMAPHIAGATNEGNTRVSFLTVENVIRVLKGG